MQPESPQPWRLAVGGLLALAVAMGIGRFVYTPILPVMAAGLKLSTAQAGLIASANFLGYLLGALAASTPRLPGSRRSWLVGGLAASALTTGLMGAVSALPAFLVIRFAGGVASAFVMVFASSLVLERLAQAGRPGLGAVHFAGVGAGIAASALIVGALAGADWRWLWLASGAVGLAAVPIVARFVPPDKGSARSAAATAPLAMGRPLLALIAAYGLFGFGYVVTATFLVAIVRDAPGLRPIEPVIWLAVGLAAAPSVAAWNLAARRVGVVPAFALACLVEALGVALSVLATGAAGALLAAAFLGGTFMAITALGFVGARALSPSDPRQVIALMTAAFGAGQIVGPVLAGIMVDRSGSFTPPTLLAAGALVAAAALSLAARPPSRG
ncbi:YbfB/YjiJ family MFS transporter [Salinarimonas soli]|uniref:YbfB/YjiJ family MFS transporter n=1 Tax=Salinarimonas soli TaxID=1638099 RepID=A0A5B2V8C1_9HYPH|nr:YbfB/YjiJ family MFS transporter [Salinarimonas soli]KAA2234682.1 YbfB/YjiJ family MFS transporter [Salinarimonas soli]